MTITSTPPYKGGVVPPTTVGAMAPPPNIRNAMRKILDRLARQTPDKRIGMANQLTTQLQAVQTEIARYRTSGVRELRAQGRTLSSIAKEQGVSISRIKQIEQGSDRGDGDRPE